MPTKYYTNFGDYLDKRLTTIALGTVASSLLVLLLVSMAPASASITQPHNADSMWIEPSSVTFDNTNASVGQLFNVTVAMNFTQSVFNWQAVVFYNRTLLKCTRTQTSAGPTSEYMTGHSTTVASGIDSSAFGNGTVAVSETCAGTDFVPGPHNGTLLWAEFQILKTTGTSTFNISRSYATTDTYVWDQNTNPITFTPYDSQYVITPEFSYLLILPIFLTSTIVAMILSKRRSLKKLK
jgi:hypothetical protein